jgi:hypothetical protein
MTHHTTRTASGDEAALIEMTHAMAMRLDPNEAMMGRAMKELMPVFLRVVASELERDSDNRERARTVETMVSACVSLTVTAAMAALELRRLDPVLLILMQAQVNDQFEAAIAQCGDMDLAP